MTVVKTIILTVALVLFGAWAYADECNSNRYVDNGDGTVTDCRSSLIWLQNAKCTNTSGGIDNPNGYLSWYNAMKWVAGLEDGLCGLTDDSYAGEWRLPTITEWRAMITSAKKQTISNPVLTNAAGTAKWTNGNVFTNVRSSFYWSSTTYAGYTDGAWGVDMSSGIVYHDDKGSGIYVWPVRGGQSGSFGNLIIQ